MAFLHSKLRRLAMTKYILLYLLLINLLGLFFMYSDKRKAQNNEYRISERTLWTVAILGGALGSTLGMNWFRHKTKHASFKWGLPALTLVELVIAFYLTLS